MGRNYPSHEPSGARHKSMVTLNRIFCLLMGLAAAGHLFGTIKLYNFGTDVFVWSLSGVVAAGLLTAINLLRSFRPADRPLTLLTMGGNLCWLGIVFLFGHSIGNFLDPRVVFHGLVAAGLFGFCLQKRCASPREER